MSRIVKSWELSKIVKLDKSCQNCQYCQKMSTNSRLSKIVILVKLVCDKLWKLSIIVKIVKIVKSSVSDRGRYIYIYVELSQTQSGHVNIRLWFLAFEKRLKKNLDPGFLFLLQSRLFLFLDFFNSGENIQIARFLFKQRQI